MSVAVFVYLVFKHYLLGNIVGNHTLCRAFCRKLGEIEILSTGLNVILLKHVDKLGERGGNEYACLVLYALTALIESLLDDKDAEI